MNTFALNRRTLLGCGLSLTLPAASARAAAPPLPVVASFSILQDLTRQIGGDQVDVTALVGADGDAHVFEPTPLQARQLQGASLLVSNGLGFESWLPRLKKAAGFKSPEVVASQGIQPRVFASAHGGHGHDHDHDHDHEHHHPHSHSHDQQQDPHAWQDIGNALLYVKNISQGLAKADPARADYYQSRASDYAARLKVLDADIRSRFAALPPERRVVVTTHDGFGYFAQAYGVRFVPVRGLSTEAEPSARDLARLTLQIRKERIAAIFVENISDPRLLQQLARESGAKMGGKLYSDALSPANGPAGTYIDMMTTNAATLLKALTTAPTGASR